MIEIGLDIATLVVAILLTPLAWLAKSWVEKGQERRRQHEDAEREELRRRAEEEREERRHRLEQDRHALEERTRTRDELREAFGIHESLTTPDVYDAMARVREDPRSRDFLVQLHRRASYRYDQFSDAWPLPEDVQALIGDALAAIARLIPDESADAQVVFEKKAEAKSGGADRTRYRVGGRTLSKHHTLHAIAVRFVAERGIRTVTEFSREWGAVIAEVIGSSLNPSAYTGQKLLTDPEGGAESYQKRYATRDRKALQDLGALELDGRRFLLAWEIGVTPAPADIGRALHIPVIEHFRDRLGYDIELALGR